MKKYILTALVLLLAACTTINKCGISNTYLEEFIYEKPIESYNSITLKGNLEDNHVRISIYEIEDPSFSEQRINEKVFIINSLYKTILSPYPGQISHQIQCTDEFKPVEVSKKTYLLYAGSRFTYGVCSWDLIKYRALMHFIYCPKQNKLYQIELFIPLEEYYENYADKLIETSCKNG